MIRRHLYQVAFGDEWGRQMRFITGPRQCGKTTLAKKKLHDEKCARFYYLWDLRGVRNRYRENELFFTEDTKRMATKKRMPWICFDEIHKYPKWKNVLKGMFDGAEDIARFIVTGSAKLEVMRTAGDSLSGRYMTFRLFPLSLGELSSGRNAIENAPIGAFDFITGRLEGMSEERNGLRDLLAYGGFPEPFTRQSGSFLRKWSEGYLDRVIREDIGALTRIIEVERIFDLNALLPEMVGSPLSYASLASHLESNQVTTKSHMRRLEDFYMLFRLTPWHRNMKRSLLKATKVYLFDWTRIEDEAKRFENYVACELYRQVSLWTDMSGIEFKLHYIRDKQKHETDFLISRNDRPWLLIEAKMSDRPIESHHRATSSALGGIPIVQICRRDGVAMTENKHCVRISASRFFTSSVK